MKAYRKEDWATVVKQKAREMGFAQVGISKAERLDEEADRLEKWLNEGQHGKMGYMENHFEKRVDPRKLVPGAKSVVSLMYNYYTEEQAKDPDAPKVSRYAYGRDYHKVVKKRLKQLVRSIEQELDVEISGRCFVDSAPVMERDWARRSGVGWMGKNTLLIHPGMGSYYFLAELIIDLPLAVDGPMKDYCGTCRRCIEACPTDAIGEEGYILKANQCISYLTIELKEAIPEEFQGRMEDWVFGCDICQEVCPWNRFAKEHEEPEFEPREGLLEMSREEWMEMTEEVFGEVFAGTAVKRAKYSGIRRNLAFLEESG